MKIIKLLACSIGSLAAGAIGSIATIPNIPTWYAGLDKPWFNPPNWIFGPVWTILYVLMGIALYLVWTSQSKRDKRRAFSLFGIQLFLNAAWSIVFFGLHTPLAAVGIIALLLIFIIMTMIEFRHFSQIAMYLLVPYLAWVSFASLLNISIAVLN